MDVFLRKDADVIISASLRTVLPDEAVRRALQTFQPRGGRVVLVAAGKAAWQMARAGWTAAWSSPSTATSRAHCPA